MRPCVHFTLKYEEKNYCLRRRNDLFSRCQEGLMLWSHVMVSRVRNQVACVYKVKLHGEAVDIVNKFVPTK